MDFVRFVSTVSICAMRVFRKEKDNEKLALIEESSRFLQKGVTIPFLQTQKSVVLRRC